MSPGALVPLELDVRVERYEGGRVLLDARRIRVLRLSDAGRAALARLLGTGPSTRAEVALARRLERAGMAHPRPKQVGGHSLGEQVGVVVPVRDRPEALARCLAALRAAGPAGLDIVVVDDGSANPAAIAGPCGTYGARLVRLSPGRGPAGARNAGLASLGPRPLVALVDSDCRPRPGWLELLASLLEDPEVAVAAPRVVPSVRTKSWWSRYALARSPLDMGPQPAEVGRDSTVTYVPSAALLARREWLVTGFDERLRYGEDVDFIWRVLEQGGRVRYEPRSVVDHDEPNGPGALLRRRFHYGTSAGPLDRRHPGALPPLRVGPLPAFAVLAGLAGRLPVAAGVLGVLSARLGLVLVPRQIPLGRAARLGIDSVVDTAEAIGRAGTMLAWPGLVVLAARRRPAWPALLALVLVPPVRDWLRRRPRLDPCRFALASLLDDVAYGCGVWWGAIRARAIGPLVPQLMRSSLRRLPRSRP
jgi:mycofactocin system glycosyltransferase